ncbi:MAG: DUF1232 domain-containing protein [Burkholderiales bacterium]|nr:DUF1232 domain-containing protein [Burkholderiales bacterium]MDR4516111.1 YkvA family protein [Nitrosomonas sp.]
MHLSKKVKHRLNQLKNDTYALYLAAQDPRTPWYVKIMIAAIVGYALSPVDLIPDFIPFFGYLDDLIVLPIGIAFAIRLIPHQVMADCRARALALEVENSQLPVSWTAGIVVILLWVFIMVIFSAWLYTLFAE